MYHEIKRSARFPGEWVVEAIDREGEGDVYLAIFSGPAAQERASDYAAWKNHSVQNVPVAR